LNGVLLIHVGVGLQCSFSIVDLSVLVVQWLFDIKGVLMLLFVIGFVVFALDWCC
jgi:hypothetical protein